ncbi:T9SS type A sorting domain-containing protein [Spirosoma aerophilum]
MKSFTFLLLMLVCSQVAQASHLLGGYIRASRVSSTALTYQVTAVLYMNEITGKAAADQAESIEICFGDGSTAIAYRANRIITNDKSTSVSSYSVIHTYTGPSTYQVIASVSNRTIVKNITNADSQLLTLRTTFSTTANQTPTPDFFLDFRTGANQKATFSLKATDADGDSLIYGLARALTSTTQSSCDAKPVATYQFPNDLTRRGTFRINSRTGELVWDTPTELGYYSVAITIDKYRNGILISQTVEEVMLLVEDRPGTPGTVPAYEPAIEGAFTGIVTATPAYEDANFRLATFPNPVEDRLQVVIQTSSPSTASLQLTDTNGRKIHELTFSKLARQHEQIISLSTLMPGVYLVQATTEGRTLTRKIVKR